VKIPDGLLTVSELADLLGISVNSVYDFAERGGGPPRIMVGRRVRYDPADVRSWIDSRRQG
jgi:excisionase family DNA binding protein